MTGAFRWLSLALATLVVADIGVFLAGIWTSDGRWGLTGVALLCVVFIAAPIVALAYEDNRESS